ncbi:hypothetical protein D3C76_1533940 [compost metagenome]
MIFLMSSITSAAARAVSITHEMPMPSACRVFAADTNESVSTVVNAMSAPNDGCVMISCRKYAGFAS